MSFRFSTKVTAICFVLICGMLAASRWQWTRYQQKLNYISKLDSNLKLPVTGFQDLLNSTSLGWEENLHRRVRVEGQFDFDHEVVVINRRIGDQSGVFVITPLLLSENGPAVLVNRGFIPLKESDQESRKKYRGSRDAQIIGLLKPSSPRRPFSPKDPATGAGLPWVDRWLRIDVDNMAKQLPFKILPISIDKMSEDTAADLSRLESELVKSTGGKDELFFLPARLEQKEESQPIDYPLPTFNTVVPAGRHLGYVYEWGVMAFMTALIGIVLQFKRPRGTAT